MLPMMLQESEARRLTTFFPFDLNTRIRRTTLTQTTKVDTKRNTLYIRMIISVFIFLLIFFLYQGHPELENLRAAHYQWLSETAQEEKAGEVSWRFYFGHCRVVAFEVLSVWYWFSTFLFQCRIETLS